MRKYLVFLSVILISFSCEKQPISTPTTKPAPTHNPRDVVASSLPAPIKSIIPTPEPTPPLGVDKLPQELFTINDGYLKVIDKDIKLKTSIYVPGCSFTGFLQNRKTVLSCSSRTSGKTLIADLEKQTFQELKDIEGNSIINVGISEDKTKLYSPILNVYKNDLQYEDFNFQKRNIYFIDQNNIDSIKPIKIDNKTFGYSFSDKKVTFLQKYNYDYKYRLCTVDFDGNNFSELPNEYSYNGKNKVVFFYDDPYNMGLNILPKISSDSKYIAVSGTIYDTSLNKFTENTTFIISSDEKQILFTSDKLDRYSTQEWLKDRHELIFLEQKENNNNDLFRYNIENNRKDLLELDVGSLKVFNKEKKILISTNQGYILSDFDGKNKSISYSEYPSLLTEYKPINDISPPYWDTPIQILNRKTNKLIQLPEQLHYEGYEYLVRLSENSKQLIDNNFFIYFTSYYDISKRMRERSSEKYLLHIYSIKDKRDLNLDLEKILSQNASAMWLE